MDSTVTVEGALVQGFHALQAIADSAEGTPVDGIATAAAMLIGSIIDIIHEASTADTEEN